MTAPWENAPRTSHHLWTEIGVQGRGDALPHTDPPHGAAVLPIPLTCRAPRGGGNGSFQPSSHLSLLEPRADTTRQPLQTPHPTPYLGGSLPPPISEPLSQQTPSLGTPSPDLSPHKAPLSPAAAGMDLANSFKIPCTQNHFVRSLALGRFISLLAQDFPISPSQRNMAAFSPARQLLCEMQVHITAVIKRAVIPSFLITV